MKILIAAAALAVALPAMASAQTAAPAAGHAGHAPRQASMAGDHPAGHGSDDKGGEHKGCCFDMAAKAEGKMACCDEHGGDKASSSAGHQGH
jgi:hypothetical protein